MTSKKTDLPSGYWDNTDNVKQYLESIYIENNLSSLDGWYNIPRKSIKRGLIDKPKYGGRLFLLLKMFYPEHEWLEWKFNHINFFWDNIVNQKRYMDWLYKELNYTSMEDWYKINKKIFYDNFGGTLIVKYNGKTISLFKTIYPDYDWLDWKFNNVENLFWTNIDNQKRYMDWLYKELHYTSMKDWYNIKIIDFKNNYGRTLICYYKNSPYNLLINVYKDIDWKPWYMFQAPTKTWNNIDTCKEYLEWLYKELKMNSMEDWYNLHYKQIANYYGGGILDVYNNSIYNMLSNIYNEYNWDKTKFSKSYSNISILWLKQIEKEQNIIIKHALNGNEHKIENTRYRADGYCEETNTIYEFHGCFYHGCPKCYPNRELINPLTKKSYQNIFNNTVKKKEYCIKKGYKYIEMWECEYKLTSLDHT